MLRANGSDAIGAQASDRSVGCAFVGAGSFAAHEGRWAGVHVFCRIPGFDDVCVLLDDGRVNERVGLGIDGSIAYWCGFVRAVGAAAETH